MSLCEDKLAVRSAGLLEAPLLAAMQAACFAESAGSGPEQGGEGNLSSEAPGKILGGADPKPVDAGADPSAWSESAFASLLSGPGCLALIALRDGEPIGFALVRQAADECEVLSLGVLPAWRRLGVGRALLSAVCERVLANGVRHVYLEVAADNYAGRALYKAFGFIPRAWRKNYYRRSGQAAIDAAVLVRDLV